ncbi:MAG: ISAzo13-like element transposase-related protein, partial [Methylocella sp.]
TKTGLKVDCERATNLYPKGIEVSAAERHAINIERHAFHGEWNHPIRPTNRSDRAVDS